MASTVIKSSGNAASVAFATQITFNALIVEQHTHGKTVEVEDQMDGDGDIVATGFYGHKEALSLSGATNGTPSVTLGASIALSGAPTGTWVATSHETSNTNTGFQKFAIQCIRRVGTET
jgi:hypothetical protein